MEQLNDTWLTDGLIDFEYKRYMLLAYLQSCERNFSSNRLYPFLGDLVHHYQNLVNFKFNKEKMANSFPKQLSQIDLDNFVLHYEQIIKDDSLMAEIEKILNYSVPLMKKHLEEGKEIYEWIESQLQLMPVGIVPLELQTGYLLVKNGEEKDTKVYEYQLTLFQNANENYRGLITHYVNSYATSITTTYHTIKEKIISLNRLLVPPAMYVIESGYTLPFGETLLPIAKRVLVRHLMENEMRR